MADIGLHLPKSADFTSRTAYPGNQSDVNWLPVGENARPKKSAPKSAFAILNCDGDIDADRNYAPIW
jgi:hypothetical protein